MNQTKAFGTFIGIYSLFENWLLNASVKLTLHKVPII
jgi:hypothetical protein